MLRAEFSHKSDVWGFAILCWEVTSLGKTPFGALGPSEMAESIKLGMLPPEQIGDGVCSLELG